MYLTCKQCNTIFRLDEKRLKPTGSKVRCCRCRNVFVAWPSTPEDTDVTDMAYMEDAIAQFVTPSPTQPQEDNFDQELEGIDLAELDSILEQERSKELSDTGDDQGDQLMEAAAADAGELDETDLDLDFESELALGAESPAATESNISEDGGEALDLDMDFELESCQTTDALDKPVENDSLEDELDMDFELGDELELDGDAQGAEAQIESADDAFGEDIESVLDDFEDVLNEDKEAGGEAPPESVGGDIKEVEEEIDLSDLEDVLEVADDMDSAAEEVDLGDFEAALDESSTAGSIEDDVDGEIDLSDLDIGLDDIEPSDIEDQIEEPGLFSKADDELALENEPEVAQEGEPAVAEDASAVEEAQEDDEFDLSDLEGLMDLDEEGESQASETQESDESLELSLDEDLEMDEAVAPAGSATAVDEGLSSEADEEEDVFDLSDLEGLMDLDEEEEGAEASESDRQAERPVDEDQALDDEGGPVDSEFAAVEEALSVDEEEVFDLSDLDGLMELDGEEEEAGAGESGEQAELSLDEDLPLAMEDKASLQPEKVEETPAMDALPSDQGDDLDLSDLGELDTMLDEDKEEDVTEPEELELSLEDETGMKPAEEDALTLEMDTESAGRPEVAEESGNLDLGGIDDLLEDEEEAADDSEQDELELSLDDELESKGSEELSLEMSDSVTEEDEDLGGLEDLDFKLDAEYEDKPVSKSAEEAETAAADEEDEEIDLTDLEQMLENETLVPEPAPQIQDSDLSLTGGDEKTAGRQAEDLGLDAGAELDLSEIEAAIDSADEDTADEGNEEKELEFDLEPIENQTPQEESSDDLELELEMEGDSEAAEGSFGDAAEAIDLSDLDLSLDDQKKAAEGEIVDAGDMELEFNIEDEMEPATIDSAETMPGAPTTAAFTKTTVSSEDDESLIDEAFVEQPEDEKEAEKPTPAKKKAGSNIGLFVILIIVLFGVAGYFGYQYVVRNQIQIPFLNNLIKSQPQDPNAIAMLTTLDINSKFIENEKAGRIFVVTGKVRNGYAVPCKKIQLQGKLFSKGKVLSKTELAYAGIIINDLELASQDVAQIKQRLKDGAQAAEHDVKPGQTMPFMVVFSALPADLDEFAIEMLSSTKVQ
jgi:pilus assembly protein FimV